jgi:hypothetical protein
LKISIAQRLKPFSHKNGASCLIPGTWVEVEAFPALIRWGEIEVPTGVIGPVKEFTLQQDLEKNSVSIFGKAQAGFFRYKLHAFDGGFELNGKKYASEAPFFLPSVWERLSLGSHKALDWDLQLRRFDLRDILPVLFGLGQKIPRVAPQRLSGTARLLEGGDLSYILRAAFHHILVPRLFDDEYQGLAPIEKGEGNPAFLLQETHKLIRALFFKQNQRRVELLPKPLFPSGRMTRLQAEGIGELDIEWASGLMRRSIVRASFPGEIIPVLQPEIKRFRARVSLSEKGKTIKAGEPLLLEANQTLYLDRFQK